MDFINFAHANGLRIDGLQTGKIVRCSTESKPNHKNGAYLWMGEWGWVQDHACHTEIQLWQTDRVMTEPEKIELKIKIKKSQDIYAKERDLKQAEATRKAEWILGQCSLDKHAYMDSKGFPDVLVNVWRKPDQDPILVIPMKFEDRICGVQLINLDGQKKFLSGQKTSYSYFKIGQGKHVYLVEGYASGLSLKVILSALKLDFSIYVCFSAGNVLKMSKKFPNAKIICDHDKSHTSQNIALESGLKHWLPPVEGQDINDMLKEIGLFKSTMLLKSFCYSV